MLKGLIRSWRARRERAEHEASDLILWLGDGAYAEARQRGRDARDRGDHAGFRHWSRVAVEIAKRTGKVIGEKAFDRYAADPPPTREAVAESRTRREIAAGLVDIAGAVADIARGRENATTLHNARARILQVVELAGSGSTANEAGKALAAALDALSAAPAENAISLAAGGYPARAEAAGDALQRFRTAVLGTAAKDGGRPI